MHRFYLPQGMDGAGHAVLDAEESKHAGKVLRLSAGDRVECFDGRGSAWLCALGFSGTTAFVDRLEDLPSRESDTRITLYQGMPKSDKLELIIQKITELGAVRVVPVNMTYSVAKAEGADAKKKCERWQRIAYEAAKQCGRALVPEVALPMSFAQALTDMRARKLMLMPYEVPVGGGLNALPVGAKDIGILIGPEGGISPEEVEKAKAAGAVPVTLGSRILRTETAAIATVAMVMLRFGDIG